MSIKIFKDNNLIIVEYKPRDGTYYILEKLNIKYNFYDTSDEFENMDNINSFTSPALDKISIANLKSIEKDGLSIDHSTNESVFIFGFKLFRELIIPNRCKSVTDPTSETISFVLGHRPNGSEYFEIPSCIIKDRSEIKPFTEIIKIHDSVPIKNSTFLTDGRSNYFSVISHINFESPIIVGGDGEYSIPFEDFEKVSKSIPRASGFRHYQNSWIASSFTDYFAIKKDYETIYEKYLSRRKLNKYKAIPELYEHEAQKYIFLRKQIQDLLVGVEKLNELHWEEKILEIILLIYPKYLYVIKKGLVKTQEGTIKKFDLTLVDYDGNIDLIEIKRPFDNCLLRTSTDRNNYVPHSILSRSIMQAEKYIYHLNKSGLAGEKRLNKIFKDEHNGSLVDIKITNPKYILILGRDNNLNEIQKRDLEVIKRQYSNVIDILCYDDLIRRLDNIIMQLKIKIS